LGDFPPLADSESEPSTALEELFKSVDPPEDDPIVRSSILLPALAAPIKDRLDSPPLLSVLQELPPDSVSLSLVSCAASFAELSVLVDSVRSMTTGADGSCSAGAVDMRDDLEESKLITEMHDFLGFEMNTALNSGSELSPEKDALCC
jgi:hypothetical protein